MTAYEKRKQRVSDLKNKISQLERDLMVVCNYPDSVSGIQIKLNWKLLHDIEKQVMAGSPTNP